MNPYSECEKLRAVHEQRVLLMDFIESLGKHGLVLCEHFGPNDTLHYTRKQAESIVFQFLGIDEKKLEEERQALIKAVQTGS